jgi:5-methylcytosine-specific restriction enzyme A
VIHITMKRLKISSKMRLEMFFKANNQCQSCQAKIHPGQKWEIDHIIPLALGGDNAPQNLQILCKICHEFKINTQDLSIIAKIKRIKIKHLGGYTEPKGTRLPCGKKSPWKKKINGQIVRRFG